MHTVRFKIFCVLVEKSDKNVIIEPSMEVTLLDDNKLDIHGYLIVPIDYRGAFSTNNTSYVRSSEFKLNLSRQFPEVDMNLNNFNKQIDQDENEFTMQQDYLDCLLQEEN